MYSKGHLFVKTGPFAENLPCTLPPSSALICPPLPLTRSAFWAYCPTAHYCFCQGVSGPEINQVTPQRIEDTVEYWKLGERRSRAFRRTTGSRPRVGEGVNSEVFPSQPQTCANLELSKGNLDTLQFDFLTYFFPKYQPQLINDKYFEFFH